MARRPVAPSLKLNFLGMTMERAVTLWAGNGAVHDYAGVDPTGVSVGWYPRHEPI